MVEYQLAQFIKEPTELMPNRILVLMYLLHIHPGGDTHRNVKGVLIVSLIDVNCRFWCRLKLFSTLYLPVKVSLMAVHNKFCDTDLTEILRLKENTTSLALI